MSILFYLFMGACGGVPIELPPLGCSYICVCGDEALYNKCGWVLICDGIGEVGYENR